MDNFGYFGVSIYLVCLSLLYQVWEFWDMALCMGRYSMSRFAAGSTIMVHPGALATFVTIHFLSPWFAWADLPNPVLLVSCKPLVDFRYY